MPQASHILHTSTRLNLQPGHETAAAGQQPGRGGRLPSVRRGHRGILCPAQCDRLVTCDLKPVNLCCDWIIVIQCDSASSEPEKAEVISSNIKTVMMYTMRTPAN